jgi:hypothetical protein
MIIEAALYPSQQHEDEKDDEDEAKSPGWIVAPTRTVGPCRESTDKKQDQDDQ